MNLAIWIIQGVLAFSFLGAGTMKIMLPKYRLREKIGGWVDPYKESQLKLIGLVEVLGAMGLIFPMLFHILSVLTPIAACGLAITMIGAARTHGRRKESIIANLVLLCLAIFVMVGRLYLVPAI
jgi:putative oxidoreductase